MKTSHAPLTALAALMLLASPAAWAATSGTTSDTAGRVVTAPGDAAGQTTGPARPRTAGNTHAKGFRAMDTNRDGVLEMSEWRAAGRKATSFQRMDTDGDGRLTTAEMQANRTARAQARQRATSGGSGVGNPPAGQ